MPKEFLAALAPSQELVVSASPFVASNTAFVNGQVHVFLANFAGLVPHRNLKPSREGSARITVRAPPKAVLHFLPFLGEEQVVTATRAGEAQIFPLPGFDRAAVAWLDYSH